MKTSRIVGLVGFFGVALAVACGGDDASNGGTGSDAGTSDGSSDDGSSSFDDGSASDDAGDDGSSGNDGSSSDGNAGDDGGSSDATSGGDSGSQDGASQDGAGNDAAADAGDACSGGALASGAIAELTDPGSAKVVASGTNVSLHAVVALSKKFLISKSKTTGKCLYAVPVADANATFAPYSAMLLTTNVDGSVDAGTVTCAGGGLIPDDVKAGDVLDVKGTAEQFAPSTQTCQNGTPPAPPPNRTSWEIARACSVTRTGTGAVPAPAVVTPDVIGIAAPNAKWANGLVKVTNVTAKTASDPFGAFTLDPSGLQVADSLYYAGKGTAPNVTANESFTSITGINVLDFCTWSLDPRSLCDMTPPPSPADGGGVCP